MKKIVALVVLCSLVFSTFSALAIEENAPVIYDVEHRSALVDVFVSRFFMRAEDFSVPTPIEITSKRPRESSKNAVSIGGGQISVFGPYDERGYLLTLSLHEDQDSGLPAILCVLSSLLQSDKDYREAQSTDEGILSTQRYAQVFLNNLLSQQSITTSSGVVFMIRHSEEYSFYVLDIDFRNLSND